MTSDPFSTATFSARCELSAFTSVRNIHFEASSDAPSKLSDHFNRYPRGGYVPVSVCPASVANGVRSIGNKTSRRSVLITPHLQHRCRGSASLQNFQMYRTGHH